VAGLGLALTSLEAISRTEGQLNNNNVNIEYSYLPYYKARSYPLVLAGVGIDFRIGKNAIITLNGNLYPGLTTIVQQRIEYSVNNGPEMYATSTNKGGFYTAGIGFRYKIAPY
jgi:hypothetical protein